MGFITAIYQNSSALPCDILVYIGLIYVFFLFFVFGLIGLLGHKKPKKKFTRRQHLHFDMMKEYRHLFPLKKGYRRLPKRNVPKEWSQHKDNDTLHLFVIGCGKTIPIRIRESGTVKMLMENIEKVTGIPVSDQVLTNGHRPMVDWARLLDFFLPNYATLHLSLRLLGGNDGQGTDDEEFEFGESYEASIKKATSCSSMALLCQSKAVERQTQSVKRFMTSEHDEDVIGPKANRVSMSPIVDNGLSTDDSAPSKRRKLVDILNKPESLAQRVTMSVDDGLPQKVIESSAENDDMVPAGQWDMQRTTYFPPRIDDSLHYLPTVKMYKLVNVQCTDTAPTFEEVKQGLLSVHCDVETRFGAMVEFRPLSSKLLAHHGMVLKERTQVYVSDHGDIICGQTEGVDNELYDKCPTLQYHCPVEGRAGRNKYLTFNILADDAEWNEGTEKRGKTGLLVHHCVIYTFIDGMPRLSEDDMDTFWSVDHINRDPTDNRLINLRWATLFEQASNRSTSSQPMPPNKLVQDSRPRCSIVGCDNPAKRGPVCAEHREKCSVDGCDRAAQQGGKCKTHGGTQIKKICSYLECNNGAKCGGVCYRHGANR